MSDFHPDLTLARFLPRAAVSPRVLPAIRALTRLTDRLSRRGREIVAVAPGVEVRVLRPTGPTTAGRLPALLWIHGGGYVLGSAAQDDGPCRALVDGLPVLVANVDYRLAPEHPFPTPLEDCYAALLWLAQQPDVDPARIAIGGASAGGGLAAALALMAAEKGEVHPVLQLLSYPMVDDRTATRPDPDPRHRRLWNLRANRFGWASYLGPAFPAGGPDVPGLAAPSRYDDLSRVAPAWVGVGTLDLFLDEDVDYARRLEEAGVACDLHVVEGAYHGFDVVEARAGVSRDFRRRRREALAAALGVR